MASEIRVDKITSLSGVGTITPSPTGIDISGITTVATLKATTGIVTTLTATTGIVTTLTTNTLTANSTAKVGSGVTLSPDGDIFATGVCTATTFSGSGASLTNLPSQVTISNNGDDRIITGGSGTNLNGEGNFTFDGTTVKILNTVPKIELNDGSSRILQVRGGSSSHNPSIVTQYASELYLGANNTESVNIGTEHLTITNGDLVIGTSGHGIDFSATANSGGVKENELLDDYEEGSFTPALSGYSSISYHRQEGFYTKIGRMVFIHVYLYVYQATGDGNTVTVTGLPFTSTTEGNSRIVNGGSIVYQNGFFSSTFNDNGIRNVYIGTGHNYVQFHNNIAGASVAGNSTYLGQGANNRYLNFVAQFKTDT